MKGFLGILLALVLMLSLVAIGLPSPVLAVSPSEVWVDDDYWSGGSNDGHTWGWDAFDKIQDGINGVTSPGTVHVAAGTYDENITLKNGVEVLGAGADVTAIDGGGSGVVVTGFSVGSGTKLDGFTVTNGSATFSGGIHLYNNSSPTISNCIFSGNSATYGGGMSNWQSSPTVTNCNFSGNSATEYGGGMYNQLSSPTVSNCIFSGNSATISGGGMDNSDSSSPTVTDCRFSGNSADAGGGMTNFLYSSPTVTNCRFSDNSATWGGGMSNVWSSPTVSNCRFSGNSATSHAGGMYNTDSSSPTVTNCIFSGNSAYFGGGMYNTDYSSPTLTNCSFLGNSAYYGGGMYNNWDSSPTVTNCIFPGNSATSSGGGMYNYRYSSPTVTNCDFWGNSASSGSGGGMYNNYYSSPTIRNNIIVSNTALAGGGIGADSTCSPTIDYNDVWNNSPNDYSGCLAGPHDISQDPLFVHPATGDYHLQLGSPCIDAGTNVGAPTADMEGKPRPIDGDGDSTATTDMGAYEYMPPPSPHFRYLHSEGSLIDLADPVSTQWHEIWPLLYRHYHLSSWEDNGDGILSYCDEIGLDEESDGQVRLYHVEEVTITLFVTHNETGKAMYIELEGGYNASVLMSPVCTQWHEIYPVFCREYHLSDWEDTNMSGNLTPCDYVVLTNNATGRVAWWHVEDVATDIVVALKPPPVGGEAYPVSKMSLLAPWIAVGGVFAGGAIWYVLRRRKAQS
ncbi:right-handed parallel beta-helix repeat-containing protein [Chloroflexota bacterium]